MLRLGQRLGAHPGLRVVPAAEARQFRRWEVAALVEGAFGEVRDPDEVSPAVERTYRNRLGEKDFPATDEDVYTDRYWLVGSAGTVAGTLGVSRFPVGRRSVRLASLYVRPSERGSGLASRAVDAAYQAATDEGLDGIILETHWTWQQAVRFYLARGMWVCSWKHDISFTRRCDLPRYEIVASPQRAAMLISHDGELVPLLVATRAGEFLNLQETALHHELDERSGIQMYARATLALRLAVDGWPLVRSEQAWRQAPHHSDIGEPEGLAYKLSIFEEVARGKGWRVATPGAGRRSYDERSGGVAAF